MTDTSTEEVERLKEAFQKAKRNLRERVVFYVLWAPVTVGDFLDRIDALQRRLELYEGTQGDPVSASGLVEDLSSALEQYSVKCNALAEENAALKAELSEARAAIDQMIADAVNEATKLTAPIAALDKMLAEAEKRGMLRAAEIAGDLDPEKPTNYLHRREDIPAAIRAEAGD